MHAPYKIYGLTLSVDKRVNSCLRFEGARDGSLLDNAEAENDLTTPTLSFGAMEGQSRARRKRKKKRVGGLGGGTKDSGPI